MESRSVIIVLPAHIEETSPVPALDQVRWHGDGGGASSDTAVVARLRRLGAALPT